MYWVNGLYPITVNGIPTFQPANPSGGIPQGTQITPAWLADVQGELLNVAQSTGIAPAVSTPTQVLQGIKRVAGGNVTTVTSSTTLTPDEAGLVLVNASSGNIVLTLPAAASASGIPLYFNVIRTDATANTVSYATAGSDLVQPGGVSSGYITANGQLNRPGFSGGYLV
jgi:hypothetical protein